MQCLYGNQRHRPIASGSVNTQTTCCTDGCWMGQSIRTSHNRHGNDEGVRPVQKSFQGMTINVPACAKSSAWP